VSDQIIEFLADKVHVHRWPQNSPLWDDSIKKHLDQTINKNTEKKQITVNAKSVQINDYEFTSIDKVGISIPFFKDECTLIFEGKFGKLFAHAHITIKNGDYLDIFNLLILWRRQFFQINS